MMATDRRRRLLIACAVLLAAAGCAHLGIDNMPFRGPEEVIAIGQPQRYLTCAQPITVPPDVQVVGKAGKALRAGGNELVIPPNAVTVDQRLVFSRPAGSRVSVDVDSPVKFQNGRSAVLRIDLRHCTDTEKGAHTWYVWRMSDGHGQSQKLRTVITPAFAITKIDSTSVFMIAN